MACVCTQWGSGLPVEGGKAAGVRRKHPVEAWRRNGVSRHTNRRQAFDSHASRKSEMTMPPRWSKRPEPVYKSLRLANIHTGVKG